MGELGEIAIVLLLLIACLVALLLVQLARREAAAVRERAVAEAEELRGEARAALAQAQQREQRAESREQKAEQREQALSADERSAAAFARALQERSQQVVESERVAAAARAAAEQEAALLLSEAGDRVRAQLAQVAGLTVEQATKELLVQLTDRASNEAAASIRRIEADARASAEERARRIVAAAVQRVAAPTSAQSVVTLVPLPSEELKGRIIGKEGRNIRTFEALTGVNVVIDDTPDSVLLSCFDAERREIATVTLQALIDDGRIHPQRIESAYADAVAGAQERTVAAGHTAAEQAGVHGLHPELVMTLGRLRLRTSYGQTVLAHLVECAQIAAAMAAEIGADVDLARRGAFLHDIGKALTGTEQGTHAHLGAELAARYREDADVVNAIAAHHDEVTPATVEAVLVQAADACSAARPGARREELDQYLERMDKLEALVGEHPGVRRALAMAAGREVRVVVEPEDVADVELPTLASAIARHIEGELSYPGEIKVTVVREVRVSATAG